MIVHVYFPPVIIENNRKVDTFSIVEIRFHSLSKKMHLIRIPVRSIHLKYLLQYSSFYFSIEKLNRDKHQSVNKIGHALHTLEPQFKKVSFSDKIKVRRE